MHLWKKENKKQNTVILLEQLRWWLWILIIRYVNKIKIMNCSRPWDWQCRLFLYCQTFVFLRYLFLASSKYSWQHLSMGKNTGNNYTLQLKDSGKLVFYHGQIFILKIVFVINAVYPKQQKIHVTFSVVIMKILQDFIAVFLDVAIVSYFSTNLLIALIKYDKTHRILKTSLAHRKWPVWGINRNSYIISKQISQAHTGSCALILRQFYLQGCKQDFILVHQSTWAVGSKRPCFSQE